jgi:hypothetical protein
MAMMVDQTPPEGTTEEMEMALLMEMERATTTLIHILI